MLLAFHGERGRSHSTTDIRSSEEVERMSAEVAVVVDEDSSDDGTNEPSRDDMEPGVEHASETLIDGAIGAGINSERAADAASDASVSAVEAEISADRSESAAQAIHQENQDLAMIAADLRAATANLAAITAANAAPSDGLLENPESVDDGVIDVEPSNDHWLTRKWNVPGFRNKKEQI